MPIRDALAISRCTHVRRKRISQYTDLLAKQIDLEGRVGGTF